MDLVDSESDYEDEMATELVAENYPQELYAGFGAIKPQHRPDDESLKQLLEGQANVAGNLLNRRK